jgi:hypothetical protein
LRRTLWRLLGNVAVLAAVILAGFPGSAVGIWAAVLWGATFIGVVFVWTRRRAASRAP